MDVRRHAVALAATLLLGAWAHGPAQAQPATPVPAAAGPTLAGVLAEVLAADPQVRQARSGVGILQSRERQARSRYWPTAGLTAVVGESTDREFGVDIQRRTDRLEGVLRWNLYNGGSDRAEITASGREIAAAEFEHDRTRLEVAERVAEAWIEAQRARAVAAASRRRLHDVAARVQQAGAQGAAGRLSEADVLQAGLMRSEIEVAHEQALADAEAARARLETLVGRPLPGWVAAGFPPLAAGAAAAHPAVRSARERAEAFAARRRHLAEALAPRLDLEWRQRIVDRTDPAPTTALRQGATVQLVWEFPLGGESLARQDETARRAEVALAEAERVELMLRAELAALEQRERAALDAVARTRGQAEQSRALLRAAEVQFEAGRRSVLQLIQSREALYAAEQRHADAQARLHQSRLKQWSTAGTLLAVLGLEPGAPAAAVEAPSMDVGAEPPAAAVAVAPGAAPAGVAAAASPAAAALAAPVAPSAVAAPPSAPAASTAAPAPAPRADGVPADLRAAVGARLDSWLAAWRARDLEAYLAHYARRFVPARGLGRAQWEAQRRRVIGQAAAIEIEAIEPRFEASGETVAVVFRQRYRSATYADEVRKRVEWTREDGAWRIVLEASLGETPGRPKLP